MKILASIICCLLLASCLSTVPAPNIAVDQPTVDIRGVLSLMYPNGNAGHACPCDGRILTARHIVQARAASGFFSGPFQTFTWEDGYGNIGYAAGVQVDTYRDLGQIAVLSKLEKFFYYKIAATKPEIGESVYWVEFATKGFKSIRRKSEVKDYFAGYMFTDRLPVPGASGSCIFNEVGEVVGIVVWGMVKGNEERGVGVLLVE